MYVWCEPNHGNMSVLQLALKGDFMTLEARIQLSVGRAVRLDCWRQGVSFLHRGRVSDHRLDGNWKLRAVTWFICTSEGYPE